jgi:hypothetical protein
MLVSQENVSLDHGEEPSAPNSADREQLPNEIVYVNFHPCPTADQSTHELWLALVLAPDCVVARGSQRYP